MKGLNEMGCRRARSRARHFAFCILHSAFCITVLSGCSPRRVALPTDSGSPFPDFASVHAQLSAACRGIRTLTAELSLAGHAGAERLRGRVHAGFVRPDSMRLEGVAPFGPPAFILASRDRVATLLLPREPAVLRGQPPEQILGALVGVTLAPADVLAIITGCVVSSPMPTAGRLHAKGWASIAIGGDAELFLRRTSDWEIRAARRNGWQIEYADWHGQQFPPAVRLISNTPAVNVDLTATITQVRVNTDLDASAFPVDVPPDARAITLEQLRDAGPLRGQ
jgi:outer membrane biogenesis lipoprotein LolB